MAPFIVLTDRRDLEKGLEAGIGYNIVELAITKLFQRFCTTSLLMYEAIKLCRIELCHNFTC